VVRVATLGELILSGPRPAPAQVAAQDAVQWFLPDLSAETHSISDKHPLLLDMRMFR
jgi:hypothetical protein